MSGLAAESVSSTQSMVLDLPPSCIEFCPAHPDFFVVGTYNLEKSEDAAQTTEDVDEHEDGASSGTSAAEQAQSRNGSILVFQLHDEKVCPVETVTQPSAVFDLHFSPHQGTDDICAAVSSTGTVSFFRLLVSGDVRNPPSSNTAAQPPARLQPLSILTISDLGEDVLFTYFAWHPTLPSLMAITTAGGQVILAHIDDDYQSLQVLESPIIEHSLEAWVVAFSNPQPGNDTSTIFSGGDDSALQYTTYSPSFSTTSSSSSSSSSSDQRIPYPPATLPGRHHTAGVTAILPLALPGANSPQHIVLTGSYDDTLRALRIAPLHTTYGARNATLLAEVNLDGGVWRLSVIGEVVGCEEGKWVVHVLASCMHAGARVLRLTGGCGANEAEAEAVEIEVLARFEEHKSMNYGSDWSRVGSRLPSSGEQGRVVCVSTSFYDKLLCVWSVKLPLRQD